MEYGSLPVATEPMAEAGAWGSTVRGATTVVPPMVRSAGSFVNSAVGNSASGITPPDNREALRFVNAEPSPLNAPLERDAVMVPAEKLPDASRSTRVFPALAV